MAIQFPCPSCRQPIEVDDEWASSHVGCPYCQKTVLAPPQTEPIGGSSIPRGRPAGGQLASTQFGDQPAVGAKGKKLGRVALGLSVAALVTFFVGNPIISAKMFPTQPQNPQELTEAVSEMQQRWMDQLSQGQAPDGFVEYLIFMFLLLSFWISGLVCGVIAVRHPAGRRPAAVALFLSAIAPIFVIFTAIVL